MRSNLDWISVLIMLGVMWLWPRSGAATEQLPPRGPALARPAACIAPTQSAPRLDGLLDDPCWESAVRLRQFNLSYQGRFAPYRTEAFLTYDADRLYVGLRCEDIDERRWPPRPWPPDKDDFQAEFLIATGIEETYYKLAVTSENEVYVTQPMGKTMEWRASVHAVMARGGGAWTSEFEIPFEAVDLPQPEAGRPWRINIGWRLPSKLNYAAWAVTHAWFYEPQYFGDLYFGGPEALTAQIDHLDEPAPGENALPVHLCNLGGHPVDCEVLVTLEDKEARRIVYRDSLAAPAGETTIIPANLPLTDGIQGVATIQAIREGASSPFFRHSIPLDLPPNQAMCEGIQHAIASVRDRLMEAGDPLTGPLEALEEEAEALAGDLARTKQAAPDLRSIEWRNLAPRVRAGLGRARRLLWRATYRDRFNEAPFAVGALDSLRKVYRDQAYEGPPAATVSLSAARGEYEHAQLLLIPLGTDLEDLQIEPTALQGPGGASIPAEEIKVQWVDFVQSRVPRYPVESIGWVGDPLIPMKFASRKVFAEALHQPLWLTVHVPRGIPAGTYSGSLRISCAGGPSQTIALRIRVFDFDLPERPALKISMWLNERHIKAWYGWEEIPAQIHRRQMQFLLEHHINPSWFGPIGDVDDVQFQIDHGMNLFMLGLADQWPLKPEMETQIERWYAFFKERGLLDMTFIYGKDEPSAHHYPEVRDTLTKVAERFPGVRRVCTAYPPVPALEGAVDTWVVGPNLFNYGPVAERLAQGDELWIYLSASVRRPYVTQFYLDYTALENRLIGLYCWKYGATGFLYWGIDEWASNAVPWSGIPEIDDAIAAGERWPDVPWNTWTYLNCNGDAQYIYPGLDGEFWSSVRLEIIRDAFEDYDYLSILDGLRKRLAEARVPHSQALLADADSLLAIAPPLASDLATASTDPNELLRHRESVAQLIEEIKRMLAHHEHAE